MLSSASDKVSSLLEHQAQWLDDYQPGLRFSEQGSVVSLGDGIAWIAGLPSAAMDDILLFADGSQAMVFDLTEGLIGAVLLQDTEALTAGTTVQRTGRTLSVPVGDTLLGRVIDPLGTPLDGKLPPVHTLWQALETPSPPIVARDFVHDPLLTGIKIIDTMIPIGKGQRQLIIGDEGLGRSSIALDTVINQRGQDVYCVYVLIGQKRSTVVNTIDILREYDALDFTTMVVAESTSLPGLRHLAPFAGCAVAEFWMQQGRDVLVIYDDLSTHAKTYRELSLLLRRPPGREAYPGDIFSVHARLLERATCLNAAHGGGSMTALPVAETQLGEIAAYIPTNRYRYRPFGFPYWRSGATPSHQRRGRPHEARLSPVSGTGDIHPLRCTSRGLHGSSHSSWPPVAGDPETGSPLPFAGGIPNGVAGGV